MTYSQKYCLVSFVKPLAIGTEFTMIDWPLHVTLAEVFAIDRSGTNIDTKLAATIANLHSFLATADKEGTLGTTHVVLLHKSPELLKLHNRIADVLAANGAIFNTPEFTRTGFLPHCTIQKTERLRTGDQLGIEAVALIDMFPGGDWRQRKVPQNFKLS